MRRNGLIVDGEYIPYHELMKIKSGEEASKEEVKVNSNKKDVKKRKRNGKGWTPPSSVAKELFRPRSGSTSSVSSNKI